MSRYGNAVGLKRAIVGDDRRAFDASLGDQDPIEWVRVVERESRQFLGMANGDRQLGQFVRCDGYAQRFSGPQAPL